MVHTKTLQRAANHRDRVRLVVDSLGLDNAKPAAIMRVLDRAGTSVSRASVSKYLKEMREEAAPEVAAELEGIAQATEEAEAAEVINVSEPVAAPVETGPTQLTPLPVPEPQNAVVAAPVKPERKPSRRWVSIIAAAVVAIVAAVASFSHMHDVALMAGQSEFIAYLLPLSVDGLIVVGSVALVDGATRKGIAWFSFAFGVVASLAANVLSADPTVLSRSVAAWPAVALLLTVEVLLQRRR